MESSTYVAANKPLPMGFDRFDRRMSNVFLCVTPFLATIERLTFIVLGLVTFAPIALAQGPPSPLAAEALGLIKRTTHGG